MFTTCTRAFPQLLRKGCCWPKGGSIWSARASIRAAATGEVEAFVVRQYLRLHSVDRRQRKVAGNMHLVFDFDGTITERDTIGVLVDSALRFQSDRGRDLSSRWSHAIEAYSADSKALKANFEPKELERTNLDEERKFLAAQFEVDEASLARVSASGIFAEIEKDHYFGFGRDAVESGRIQIRQGFRELVEYAAVKGWMINVISINWSRDFIAGALHPFDPENIIANDLSVDGSIRGPRNLQRKLTSPWDKLEALENVVKGHTRRVVYFGDSVNDIECLLRGGIVIAESEDAPLLRTLRRVGVQTPRLSWQTVGSSLSWTNNFEAFMNADKLEHTPKREHKQ